MARIIGGIGASHTPTIGFAKDARKQNDPAWAPIFEGFAKVREWVRQQDIDVLFMIYNDHVTSFFFDHYSAFVLGVDDIYHPADEGGGPRRVPPVRGHAALARHVAFREAWCLKPQSWFREQRQMERYGYEQMLALWQQPEHPEGLIVFPDNIVPGILAAMQQLHLRAPDDLQLALHKNREVDYVCPFPATLAVYSIAEVAAGYLAQLRMKLTGESPAPLPVAYNLEENVPYEIAVTS